MKRLAGAPNDADDKPQHETRLFTMVWGPVGAASLILLNNDDGDTRFVAPASSPASSLSPPTLTAGRQLTLTS